MAKKAKPRKDCFFGLHFDLHPGAKDTSLGADITEGMIDALIDRVRPDFVQYDCKGHAGYTGYPTKVGWASPGIVKDSLRIWRRVTKRRGVGLYIHYSGVWDWVAVHNRPRWARTDEKGKPDADITSTFGRYVDELLIPQLKEVARKYDLDGAWVDGDCWAVRPDYCKASLEAFRRATGRRRAPKKPDDPLWREFLDVQREQFEKYLARYVDALHQSRPGFQIASNWMYTSFAPDPVRAPVDFLSGDYSPGDSVNTARLEARYIASTGMPWDLMAWGFNKGPDQPWQHKTAVHLKQEAAVVLGQGGGFQIYYQPTRSGWLDDWMTAIMAEVAQFCRARKAVSFRTESVPQVALVLSAESFRDRTRRVYAPWDDALRPVHGALHALLESGYSVDVLAEHQIEGRLAEYPLVVLPECHVLPKGFRKALGEYLSRGGRVLCIGAEAAGLFRKELGARLSGRPKKANAFVEGADMLVSCQGLWQAVELDGAKALGMRRATFDPRKKAQVAATVARCGKGRIACIYGPAASVFRSTHHPALRAFIGAAVEAVFPDPTAKLDGPPCIDLALRRKEGKLLIHLANTAGMQSAERYAVIDLVPSVGPVSLTVRLPRKPRGVKLVGGRGGLTTRWSKGTLRVKLDRLHVHAVVAIDT